MERTTFGGASTTSSSTARLVIVSSVRSTFFKIDLTHLYEHVSKGTAILWTMKSTSHDLRTLGGMTHKYESCVQMFLVGSDGPTERSSHLEILGIEGQPLPEERGQQRGPIEMHVH